MIELSPQYNGPMVRDVQDIPTATI
jgi:hypothetical protein